MKFTDINVKDMLRFDPENGKLLLNNDRLLLIRKDAMQILRRLVYNSVGTIQARALLSQFGYQCGQGDFKMMTQNTNWDTDIDRLACGPMMQNWEGLVSAKPEVIDINRDTGHFHMTAKMYNSYEAEIHEAIFGKTNEPVCHSLTGYASGW